MQSLHHLLIYVVHEINYMLRYLLSIYLSSISITPYLLILSSLVVATTTAFSLAAGIRPPAVAAAALNVLLEVCDTVAVGGPAALHEVVCGVAARVGDN